ncbi:hypothetical protein SP292_003544 [Escherichia coli]|nr:hypothetical protein [Escherichia coli]
MTIENRFNLLALMKFKEDNVTQLIDIDHMREFFQREFLVSLRQINNRKLNVQDDELGPIKVKPGGVVYQDKSELSFEDPTKDEKNTGPVPIEAAERVLQIIIMYLKNNWQMPDEMREYLSLRFTKALNSNERLQSLFHLRESERNTQKVERDNSAGNYIVFRKILHAEIKKEKKSSYLQVKEFNKMLSYELFHLFNIENLDERKIKKLKSKSTACIFTEKSVGDFLNKNIELVNKYKSVLNKELNQEATDKEVPGLSRDVDRDGEWRDIRLFILDWMDKKISKKSIYQ